MYYVNKLPPNSESSNWALEQEIKNLFENQEISTLLR